MERGSKRVGILWLLAQSCKMFIVLNRKYGRRLLQKCEINLKRNAICSWQLIWSMWLSTFWTREFPAGKKCWPLHSKSRTPPTSPLIKYFSPPSTGTAQVTEYNTHRSLCALCCWLRSAPVVHENQALEVHNCSHVLLHVADAILLRWWSTANLVESQRFSVANARYYMVWHFKKNFPFNCVTSTPSVWIKLYSLSAQSIRQQQKKLLSMLICSKGQNIFFTVCV